MDRKNLPTGLNMALSMNKDALEYYSTLKYDQHKYINDYIQNSNDGVDAKKKIEKVIKQLEKGNII